MEAPDRRLRAGHAAYLFLRSGMCRGMEFKDRAWGGKWDWLDFIATCIGGAVGQAVTAIVVYLILK